MVAAGLPVTSVIRIQISVCTSQDIGAPKRAINRDTLLVRENSIYVKKTRHPMIDSRNISRYRFLLPSRPNFLFSSVSRLLARIQTNFSYRRSLFESRSKVNTCVYGLWRRNKGKRERWVRFFHPFFASSHSARKCLGRVKTNSLFRAPPRNFATSSSAIWPIAIHGVSRVIIEPSKLFKLPSIVHATPLNSDL